ncbi:ISL3 family transposase [Gordonia sp. NB41Y]|nr:ISL3 family transposase [Gordonia sp. NB41Y]WLP88743.1 ISL3 family transposase [Gordonia sp. NB41Y]WLP92978.1 ISL3 family transposase [Gordonia sp. NB41Y]WLP93029.1 ISL3 family transposase [Gordonia sp. NB41Y]WLP93080.1 ISL3 family transposase [Gordonia sp. NB41Y]WLP93120.1 ISL3 family transposase [Gordonia sp. NB41Y]
MFGLRRLNRRSKALRTTTVLQKLLGVEHLTVLDVEFVDNVGTSGVVVTVRAHAQTRSRCPRCHKRCPGYDQSNQPRRWRHLDLGGWRCYLQASVRRVRCPEHGVLTEEVPWARPGAKVTRAFDDTAAWLTAHCPATAVCEYLRVSWRTVTRSVERVVTDYVGTIDRLDNLRRIGIDEIAYRKGHRYLTVIVDHDSGRLVWAREGARKETLHTFFDELGEQRTAQLTHVSADAAKYIAVVVAERAPDAIWCMDPFHVVQWATKALDRTRQRVMHRITGLSKVERRNLRWAMLKNPENLTDTQLHLQHKVVSRANDELARAYQLKEQLRYVFHGKHNDPWRAIGRWIICARESGIIEMRGLATSVEAQKTQIYNSIVSDVSNARVEATNTHLRAITKRAYGFHTPEALIAMSTLTRGGACPTLPQRN